LPCQELREAVTAKGSSIHAHAVQSNGAAARAIPALSAGMLLVSVNGERVVNMPYSDVLGKIIQRRRPLALGFCPSPYELSPNGLRQLHRDVAERVTAPPPPPPPLPPPPFELPPPLRDVAVQSFDSLEELGAALLQLSRVKVEPSVDARHRQLLERLLRGGWREEGSPSISSEATAPQRLVEWEALGFQDGSSPEVRGSGELCLDALVRRWGCLFAGAVVD
jgi:hypothetical protein